MPIVHQLLELGRTDPSHAKLPQKSLPVQIFVEHISNQAHGDDRCTRLAESHRLFGHIADLIAEHIAEQQEAKAPEERAGAIEQQESSDRDFEETGQCRRECAQSGDELGENQRSDPMYQEEVLCASDTGVGLKSNSAQQGERLSPPMTPELK